jgi:hypothetical protein
MESYSRVLYYYCTVESNPRISQNSTPKKAAAATTADIIILFSQSSPWGHMFLESFLKMFFISH